MCMYVCIYIYIYIYTYINMYIYIYIYTGPGSAAEDAVAPCSDAGDEQGGKNN